MFEDLAEKLKSFRQSIYDFFQRRVDASFELVDALASNTQAKQIVELSLNPHYRRNYCSITRTLDEFYHKTTRKARHAQNDEVSALLASQCPPLVHRAFHLFAIDCTSNERLFSPTLRDRSPVYTPRPSVAGNKPITIGHQYSVAVYLPEKLSPQSPPWVVPLSSKRVSTKDNNTQVGMKQMSTLIQTGRPFKEQLCVLVADSAYSTPDCLCEVSKNENQVHISRLRNNRSLPRALSEKKPGRGRPRKYGNPFKLGDKRTWGKPTQTEQFTNTNKKGKIQNIKIDHWEDITLRTPYKIEAFRIVRIGVFKSNGDRLFKCPLWLLIAGKRRNELTLRDIFESYRQRFDIEHFFRLGKTRLLLDKFQTPEVVHEEAWWQLAMIAYTELYLARQIVHDVSTPWGKYLPEFKSPREESSPSQVQKCFDGIIREFGTPAKAPKPRNKSEGRHQGEIQKKRPRYKVVFKEQKNHVFSSA